MGGARAQAALCGGAGRVRGQFAWLAALAALAACSESTSPSASTAESIRAEEACAIRDLPVPMRQTVIMIDEASLRRAPDAAALRESNRELVEAVSAFADASAAVGNGTLSPRERVSLVLAPADGGGARVLFSGCAPALTVDERQRLEGQSSWGEDFTSSGAEDRIDAMALQYRTGLLGALLRAGQQAPEAQPPAPSDFVRTALVRSLRATPRLADPSLGLARVILIAPAALQSVPVFGSVADGRTAGFGAASQLGLDLAQTEFDVAVAPRTEARDYVAAFLLGSGANLASWSSRAPSALGHAPAQVRSFVGEFNYGGARRPIRLLIASDSNGALVNSWIVIGGSRARGVPLTGTIVCAGERCRVTSDEGGFAQAWSREPGGDPEFDPQMPFVGLRNVEIMIDGAQGQGRVFDPFVDDVGGSPDIRFNVRRAG